MQWAFYQFFLIMLAKIYRCIHLLQKKIDVWGVCYILFKHFFIERKIDRESLIIIDFAHRHNNHSNNTK